MARRPNNHHRRNNNRRNNRRNNRNQPPPMTETHAPYNFVPLSSFVFTPDWADEVSQDIPLKDGYCGTIDLTITTKTPLLIGGDRDKSDGDNVGEVKAFITPDKQYAIPGSSLRGMIRNVLTIASFGKMNQVNDVRLAVRDMHRKAYTGKITNFVRGRDGGIRFKVKAGFLQRNNGVWQLTPCEHARIESNHLNTYLNNGVPQNQHVDIRADGMSASDKYRLWQENDKALENCFRIENAEFHHRNNGQNIEFSKAFLDPRGDINGVLVFTEQMGSKHREFVFHTHSEVKSIPEPVLKDFMHVYENTNHWKFLNSNNYAHSQFGIPVFYLGEPNNIKAIGLVQLVKLAAPKHIKELIADTSADHNAKEKFDLAELIFGHLEEHKNSKVKGLKARAHFGLAKLQRLGGNVETSDATILGEPKASFYPHYLEQNENANGYLGPNRNYKTYLDSDAKIRGWKRYPIRATINIPQIPVGNNNYDVQVKLEKIPAQSTFKAKLHFHNLKKEELGALIWALEFGGRENNCHSLGLGKPFGMGAVHIKTAEPNAIANDPQSKDKLNKQDCLNVYQTLMERKQQNWDTSPQMKELLALTDIVYGEEVYKNNTKIYDSLILNPEENIDEFVTVKKKITGPWANGQRQPPPEQQKFILRRHASLNNFQDTPSVDPNAPVMQIGTQVEHKRLPIYGEIIEMPEDGKPTVMDTNGRRQNRYPLSDYIFWDTPKP